MIILFSMAFVESSTSDYSLQGGYLVMFSGRGLLFL